MGAFYSQLFVTPEYPTTSFADRTVIVTGSNVGIGFEAAKHFVRLNAAKVVLAVRNVSAGEAAKELIEKSTARAGVCEIWELDLASFDSVREFAERALKLPRLDIVVENAGIATSVFNVAEGHERTITVNVIRRSS
jgi:NAD(P)-dependent dehydrogenase (short-subunit alcohol dehydrogenase family)